MPERLARPILPISRRQPSNGTGPSRSSSAGKSCPGRIVRASVPLSSSILSKIGNVFCPRFFGSIVTPPLSSFPERGHADGAPALMLVIHFLRSMNRLLRLVGWFWRLQCFSNRFIGFTLPRFHRRVGNLPCSCSDGFTCIQTLFLWGSPPAIERVIALRVVNTVQGGSFGTLSHIIQEIFK